MILENKNLIISVSFIFLAISIVGYMHVQTSSAACKTMPSDKGTVTGSFDITKAGSYRVWVRMRAPDATNNSLALQLDDGVLCNVNVGDSDLSENTWTWVDWKDGDSANKIDVTLDAGTHSYKLAGREENVRVDDIILIADGACVPSGIDGSNCSSVVADQSGAGGTTSGGSINPESTVNSPSNKYFFPIALLVLAILIILGWFKRKSVMAKLQQVRNKFKHRPTVPAQPSVSSGATFIHPTNIEGDIKE
ncbi:MAG: hypothetical protein M3Q36_04520 [bacterium]|nr:hypothetical protein [bacterium]